MGKFRFKVNGWLLLDKLFAAMPETMEISDAAKSGDGSTANVGIKMTGSFQCPDCRQKFDSEKAKQLHWRFIHDPTRHQEDRVCKPFVRMGDVIKQCALAVHVVTS